MPSLNADKIDGVAKRELSNNTPDTLAPWPCICLQCSEFSVQIDERFRLRKKLSILATKIGVPGFTSLFAELTI